MRRCRWSTRHSRQESDYGNADARCQVGSSATKIRSHLGGGVRQMDSRAKPRRRPSRPHFFDERCQWGQKFGKSHSPQCETHLEVNPRQGHYYYFFRAAQCHHLRRFGSIANSVNKKTFRLQALNRHHGRKTNLAAVAALRRSEAPRTQIPMQQRKQNKRGKS